MSGTPVPYHQAVEFPARRCGARRLPDGSVEWRVWAPKVRRVELVLLDGERRASRPMEPEAQGYFRQRVPAGHAGLRYCYRLDDGPDRPDPCSLYQPEGVHGPSAIVATERFAWTDHSWRGVARADLVLYELHTGTFTAAGTFDAIIPRLAELRALGITALELMPVGQFPGPRNWGYDGVFLYAAQNSYGGPASLQRLVDACHAHGLALVLDVVYNHLGPEGNYLAEFGPYFTDRYKTPWGTAVNYDGPASDPVRDFVLDNARMWLEEFHIDGLRLDAVHAIFDLGARHILRAIQAAAEDVAARTGWPRHIIAESDLNDPRLLLPPDRGGYGLDAQWSDDFHHALHVFLTGETQGYYADYGALTQLPRVLEQPFLYTGDYSASRDRKHGAPPDGLAGDRFVVCLQNHDQIGNRARGDRLNALLRDPAQQRLAASLLFLSPYLPLIFMGEEYGETSPFPFFCSFGDEALVQAVRDGRQKEFAAFAWQGHIPDPQAVDTFDAARLSWSWPDGSSRAGLRQLYHDLLAARRQWPALHDFERRAARLFPDAEQGPVLELVRGAGSTGPVARIYCNLGDKPRALPASAGDELLFRSEAQVYRGNDRRPTAARELAEFECVVFGPRGWPCFGREV